MKLIHLISLLASLSFASTGSATNLGSATALAPHLGLQSPLILGAPPEQGQPIRMATADYKVQKTTMTREEDGSFNTKVETFCEDKIPAPVFDIRNGDAYGYSDFTTCKANIGGQETEVLIYAAIVYQIDPTDGAELKTFSGFATYLDPEKEGKAEVLHSGFGTKEHSLTHARFSLLPDVLDLVRDIGEVEGERRSIEVISVTLDITDSNQ